MKIKFDRIISIATLVAALVAIILVLKKPAPVAAPGAPAPTAVAEHAATNDQGTASTRPAEQPYSSGTVYTSSASSAPAGASVSASQPTGFVAPANTKGDPQVNSDQISSAITKMLGGATGASNLTPDTNVGNGEPTIKDQQVTMDGDIVHGRFLTQIAGKDVWVTISGHMGEKDGYATFDPTEFKVGDMNVPVSLVNPALQRKLAEERDRLKIPNN
jgi:hypothetical protein